MKNVYIATAILGLLVIFLLVSGVGCSKDTSATAEAESLDSSITELNDFSADLENFDIGTIDDSELVGLEDFAV